MRSLSGMACFFLVLVLAGCGSGSGSGDSSGYSVSPDHLSFTATTGTSTTPPSKTIAVKVNAGEIYFDARHEGNAISEVSLSTTGATTAEVIVMPRSPSSMTPGTYSSKVYVYGYSDPFGDSTVSGSPKVIDVTYTVLENLVVSPSLIDVSTVEGSSEVSTTATLDPGSPTMVWSLTSSTVEYSGSYADWLSITPATGNFTGPHEVALSFAPLSAGTHSATITLMGTRGTGDAMTPFIRTVGVVYNVENVLSLSTPSAFVINDSSVPADMTQTIAIQPVAGYTGDPVAFEVTASQPWLKVTPLNGSSDIVSSLSLELDPAALADVPYGTNSVTVTVTPTTGGLSPVSTTLELHLALPTVNTAAPHVIYVGRSDPITIRGGGFAGDTPPSVMFGDTKATDVTVESDTEIHVIPPPFVAATAVDITIPNSLAIPRGTAQVAVIDTHVFPAASSAVVPALTLGRSGRIIFDGERNIVYIANIGWNTDSRISKFTWKGGTTWEQDTLPVTDLCDIALTVDGKELLALDRTTVTHYDPVNLTAHATADISTSPDIGSWGIYDALNNLAMTDTGASLIMPRGGYDPIYTYDPATQRFAKTTSTVSYTAFVNSSEDGGFSVITLDGVSPAGAVKYYDSSTGTFTTAPVLQNSKRMSLDRSGSRIVSQGGSVFDRSFTRIGRLASGAIATALSPNGLRAYGYTVGETTIKVYDVSAAVGETEQFPVLADVTLPAQPGDDPVMTVSGDGSTLFLAGSSNFAVVPLP